MKYNNINWTILAIELNYKIINKRIECLIIENPIDLTIEHIQKIKNEIKKTNNPLYPILSL